MSSRLVDSRGRLGLALSGGGFRAAFFHLGVLAQMARHNLLHQVEVISTVSGGSVIGALYYLHARNLLQSRPDPDITPADYEQLVDVMSRGFLAAVQKNIRTRAFARPDKNLRMAFDPRYSRSDRIGELYDRHLYGPVVDGGSLELRDLTIQPPDEELGFYPKDGNAARTNKVPMLRINATTLNTGRSWRFEAARMGEPGRATPVEVDVDRIPRLCRPDGYDRITDEQDDFPLGLAVAASTCVPGMFAPLAVSNLYPDLRVQLVDGGVHDNLGIAGLLDLDCERFVISDAGGQLDFLEKPSTGLLGVLSRANSILFNRVREEQLFRFMERELPHAFVHLRRGLPARTIPYVASDGSPADVACRAVEHADTPCEAFGVDPRVQERLARVRTDLDSFSETEAFSLTCDGYKMSEQPLGELAGRSPDRPAPRWPFLAVENGVQTPSAAVLRRLDVARHRFGKSLRLGSARAVTAWLVLLLLITGPALLAHRVGFLAWGWSLTEPSLSLRWGILAVVGLALVTALAGWAAQRNRGGIVLRWAPAFLFAVIRAVLLLLLVIPVLIHLLILDRLFLADGRVVAPPRTEPPPPPRGAGRGRPLMLGGLVGPVLGLGMAMLARRRPNPSHQLARTDLPRPSRSRRRMREWWRVRVRRGTAPAPSGPDSGPAEQLFRSGLGWSWEPKGELCENATHLGR